MFDQKAKGEMLRVYFILLGFCPSCEPDDD